MKIHAMNAFPAPDESIVNDTRYIFEPKLDGIRAICEISPRSVTLFSRNNTDLSSKYPHLLTHMGINARSCILDGEIIAFNEHGIPSFSALQQGSPSVYIVFDILMYDGKNLCNLPLLERKKILKFVLFPSAVREQSYWTENGPALLKEMKKRGFEGVMAKLKDGVYLPGERTRLWLKIRFRESVDAVVIGYTSSKRVISSLILALYTQDKKLRYIGHVGSGFSENSAQELKKIIDPLKQPAKEIEFPKNARLSDITWVKPELVVEVLIREFTPTFIMRQARFVRIRTDKKKKDCTFESLGLRM